MSALRPLLTRRILRVCLLAGVLVCGTPFEMAAQAPPATLTLEGALRLAREHSPQYRQVMNDARVAAAEVRQSYGAFLPSINASLGFNGMSTRTSTGQGNFGEVIEDVERTVESSSASHGMGARMTLFDGGAMFRRVSAARAHEEAAEATIAASLTQLDATVQRAWHEAQRAERLIELEERLLASARERLERSEELFRIAAATQVDVLGARVDVASQEQTLATARDAARKDRLVLLETIGLPPQNADAFMIPADAPAAFDPASLDMNALVAQALQASPAVLQRHAMADAASREAEVARAGRWPSIDANVNYNRSLREPGAFDAFGQFGAQQRGFSFGLSASLPIFSNFRTAAAIARAEAGAEDAREQARAMQLQTEREVRAAVIDLENAHRQLTLAEQKAELSAQRLELATEQYRLGALDFLSLQRVIDDTSNAERQALDARYGFVRARIALEEKLGTSLPRE